MSVDLRSWLLSHHQEGEVLGKFEKAKVIAFTSGKGGVGKTSLSLKTGKLLAQSGYRTLVVDCDYNLSNTFVKLGIRLSDNFQKFIRSLKDFDDCLYREGNLHLLAGCNGDLDLFEDQLKLDHFYINLISQIEKRYDYIILDTPAGMSKDLMSLNAYADYRVFVVTPDRSSITDSYSCIKVLNQRYGIKDNFLLVNSFDQESQFKNIVKAMSETVENFLQAKLMVVGGVYKSKTLAEKFDHELLHEENSALHHDVCKVVMRLADLVGRPNGRANPITPDQRTLLRRNEHDVHSNLS
jgi:flagellar biosynthesis protein FlhG